MSGENVLKCVAYDCNLTVDNFLIECGDFAEVKDIMMLRIYDNCSKKTVLHMYLTSSGR